MRTKCRCGKIAWPSEEQAKDVLVRLKIKASLKGNTRRQETRAYPCNKAPGWWHLTSLPSWDDPETQVAVRAAADMDRDAAIEQLLDVIEQHSVGVQRLVAKTDQVTRENDVLRDVVRGLAQAINIHKSRSNVPSWSDKQLWNVLAETTLPSPAGKVYVSTLLQSTWANPEELAANPVKLAISLGAKRLVCLALGYMGIDIVTRSTVRALLPRGADAKRVSVKFGMALQHYEEHGLILRDGDMVRVLDPEALAARALTGIDQQDPRGVLDIVNARKVVQKRPPSEQRDLELEALERLER